MDRWDSWFLFGLICFCGGFVAALIGNAKDQHREIVEIKEQIRGVDHYHEAYRIRFEKDIDELQEKVEALEKSQKH